jgi:MscS family membrane protein
MIRRFFLLFASLLLANFNWANDFSEAYMQGNDFSTPRRSVANFIANLQDDNYHPELAVKSFNFTKVKGRDNKQEHALLLKKYIDAKGYLIDEALLSDKKDYYDSSLGINRFYPFIKEPRIYLELYNGKWLISKTTVAQINTLYHEAYPFGSSWFLKLLPRQMKTTFFGIHTWKWIGLLYLLVFSLVLFYFFRFIVAESVTKIFDWLGKEHFAIRVFRPVSGPSSILMVVAIIRILFPLLQFPVQVSFYAMVFFKIAIPVLLVVVCYKLVDIVGIYFSRLAEKTESKLDDQLVPLLRKILKVLVVALGVLFVLQNLDFNITGVLAGLSIGGLALALAAQDTVKNFLGSLMIFIDKPFQIGDWVTGDGFDGNIEEVGFRATRIRTFRNSLMYVPNAKLADVISDNHGKRQFRRYNTKLSLTYDTSPESIEAFLKGLRLIVENHPDTVNHNYHIYLNDFGASSLDIMFYVFFQLPDWGDELKSREDLMFLILQLAKELNIRFAYPTQTLHVEKMPGQLPTTPTSSNDKLDLNKRVDAFIGQRFTKPNPSS